MTPRTLLILGGTAEAAELARRADAHHGKTVRIITSLAGRTRAPRLPGEMRAGGFGGAEGLRGYLEENAVSAVIDATHPFAATISAHARDACLRARVPRLALVRPPWQAGPGDRWIEAADFDEAARLLPGLGRRAFLALGRDHLAAFADIEGMWFLVRVVDASGPVLPLAAGAVVAGRPPFSTADEEALMTAHGIEVLVTKQSGGTSGRAKLEAAGVLGIPVLLIGRPAAPEGGGVATVEEALAWFSALIACPRRTG